MTLRARWRYSRACSFRRNQRVPRRQSEEGALVLRCTSIRPAIKWRSSGVVNAGVRIFSPPRLPIQEPRGQQRQGLTVAPRRPIPHLVVRQPRLALGALEAFLDPVRRLRRPRQFRRRHAWTRRFTPSITRGLFSPSRTSIRAQADSGKAARHRSSRKNGLMGQRPRPESSGGVRPVVCQRSENRSRKPNLSWSSAGVPCGVVIVLATVIQQDR